MNRQGPRLSIFVKLSLAFVLVAFISVTAVSVLSRELAAREFEKFIGDQLLPAPTDLLAELATFYTDHQGWSGVEAILGQDPITVGGRPFSGRVLLADQGGNVVADNRGFRAPGGQTVQPLPGQELDLGWAVVVNDQQVGTLMVFEYRQPGQQNANQEQPSVGQEAAVNRLQRNILTAGAVAGVVALLLGILFAWELIRPLRRLTAAADAIAKGDLTQRVEVEGNDEVGELAEAFNHMAGELDRAGQLRRNLTADVAHELRTPLSVIRSHVEALQDGIFDLDLENLQPIYDKTVLLNRLVDDLRELALADAGQLPLSRVPTDLSDLVVRTAAGFQAVAEQKRLSLQIERADDLPSVMVDQGRISQVLNNLLSNAIRHTPAGGSVTVRVREDGEMVCVDVSDTGEGIPPEELPVIFERLYRGDPARGRVHNSDSTGLGLAITRGIIESHGGRIAATSELGKGSTFTFCLPVGV